MLMFLLTPAALVEYHDRQAPAMQDALRAFWRSVAGARKPESRAFAEALATIHHRRRETK